MPQKLRMDEVKKSLLENCPNIDLSLFTEYKGQKEPISVICKKCSYQWESDYRKLISGRGCPNCAGNIKMTTEQFREHYQKQFPEFDFSEVIYHNNITMFDVKHSCGTKVRTCKRHLDTRGLACPFCDNRKTYNQDYNFQRIKETATKFDFSGSIYLGMNKPLTATCKDCHTTITKKAVIYLKNSCNTCYNNSLSENRDKNLKLLQDKHTWATIHHISGKLYKTICNNCKTERETLLQNELKRKPFCPDCQKEQINESRIMPLDEIKHIYDERFPNLSILWDTYKGVKKSIFIVCKECGNYWESYLGRLNPETKNCPKCAKKSMQEKRRLPKSIAQDRLKHRTDITIDWDNYIDTLHYISVSCSFCSYTWQDTIGGLLRYNRRCPECNLHKLVTPLSEAKERLKHRTDITADWDTYTGVGNKISVTCNTCSHTWQTKFIDLQYDASHCPKCSLKEGRSRLEKSIQQTLEQEFGISADTSVRFKTDNNRNLEFDIYYPDYNLAIEVNGIYWHSDEVRPRNYHQWKSDYAEQNHINLIHIFEDDWFRKREQYISMIGNYLKSNLISLNARDCYISAISGAEAGKFYNQNHLQGSVISQIHLGLFYKENLVSVMSFSGSRYNKSYQWELTRFANHIHTNIRGSASKLLSHFIRNHNPKSIVSYANRLWSQGNLYRKLGFVETHRSQPSYFYIDRKTGVRLSRYQCQRKYLPALLGTGFEESKSESENMKDNGYLKIHNSGTITFVYQNQKD